MKILSRNTKKEGNKYIICNREKYYKKDSKFYECETDFKSESSKIGTIHLTNKNIFSYGVRSDNSSDKIVGLRPDDNQDGSRQIEFSIKEIKYDDVSIDFNISNPSVNNNRADLGDVIFENTPGRFSQLYKATNVNDFSITLEMDLTGYEIENSKFKDKQVIKDIITAKIHNIGNNTASETLKYIGSNDIEETDNKQLDFIIGKITDKNIMLGAYTLEEQFADTALEGFTTTITPHNKNMDNPLGGSTYMENTIAIYCKGQNIDPDFFEDIITTNLCDKLDLELLKQSDESDVGEYFLYNGKKVGSWYVMEDNQFVAYFNTQDIPSNVKELFKTKDFNQTSYIDLELNILASDLNTIFNQKQTKIEVDTDCYISSNGVFTIKDSDRKININKPIVIKDDKLIDLLTGHKLKQISANKYEYTKFIYPECSMLKLMNGTCYIDPTLDVDSKRFESAKASTGSGSSWLAARNSSSYSSSSANGTFCASTRSTSLGVNGAPSTTGYNVKRSSWRWDVSSVSDVDSGTLTSKFKGNGTSIYGIRDERAKSSVYVFSDFDAWVADGSWDEEDYTTGSYTAQLYINNQAGPTSTATAGVEHSFDLTDAAITQINDNSYIDIIMIHERDIENAAPTSTTNDFVLLGFNDGSYYSTDIDLVLSAGTSAIVHNATFFGTNF